jgi:RNA polymerase sigma-70 factor (ECF subfamily)
VSATIAQVVSHVGEIDGKAMLAAAQRGSASAQAALFDAYKHQIARRILRMTGDPTGVDDLVQEVFISAFTGLASFRGDAALDTWLYRITVNKVHNWWDAQRRRRGREAKAATVPPPAITTPEEEAQGSEHLARLYEALGHLPGKYREAFVARAIEGMSLQETSEMLGVPVSTISYRTRKAEQMLCDALGIEFGGQP